MGFHALLQGIFPTQGLNPGLPRWRHILYYLSHQGSCGAPSETQGGATISGISPRFRGTQGFPGSSAGKESTCNSGDSSSVPGLRRSPGEGICYPLQYSWGSMVAQMVKNPLQCGKHGFDPWVGKIPWRRAC